MANKFCRYLSNGYRIQSTGNKLTWRPCCWYSQEYQIDSPLFNQVKEKISKIDSWTPACGQCKSIEDSGMYDKSPRARSALDVADENAPDNHPVRYEINLDQTCNAACIMCSPAFSTTWEKQVIKFGIKTMHDFPDRLDPEESLKKMLNKVLAND